MILQAVKAPLETTENRYGCISVENEKDRSELIRPVFGLVNKGLC